MMNYSDYDSDGYSSNEDADYVPSDDNKSEDDMNECVKEDGLEGDEAAQLEGIAKKKGKKRKSKEIGVRKRKKGGLKLEEVGPVEEKKAEPQEEEEEEEGHPADWANSNSNEEKQKKKADDLWASFLSDVGTRPKPAAPVVQSSKPHQASPIEEKQQIPAPAHPEQPEPEASQAASKVTITKVFDFAGEEVRVTKEVSADSREAKSYLKSQEKDLTPVEQAPSSRLQPGPPAPGPSVKRPGGMSSVLNRLGAKKQKMSTLEKSKMDWDCFKTEEGIGDELAIHNRGKEGYVERKNFLERVDQRQFEQEKKVRLGNMKR